jgi:hypothetical protein
MEEILDANNGYIISNPSEFEFMQAQTSFLQGETGIFFCNGDWFDNEMKTIREQIIKEKGGIDTFKTMRMPIISDLGTKLGITDAELSAIVDYVDGTIATAPTFTSTKGLSNDDVIAAVKEARTVVYSLGPNHQAGIPVYAKGKDVAVDFLRFMATDIAHDAYIKATRGASLPFKYDVSKSNPAIYNNISDYQKVRQGYFTNTELPQIFLPMPSTYPLARFGGVGTFTWANYYTTFSAASNTRTAEDYYNATIDHWTDSKWAEALANAGM